MSFSSYDSYNDEVRVSHSSPVLHNYGNYPQNCIPLVPNPEASLPNQYTTPGQQWIPMTEQHPTQTTAPFVNDPRAYNHQPNPGYPSQYNSNYVSHYQQQMFHSTHYASEPHVQFQSTHAPYPTYGMYAPEEHLHQQQLAQNAQYDPEPVPQVVGDQLLLNTPLGSGYGDVQVDYDSFEQGQQYEQTAQVLEQPGQAYVQPGQVYEQPNQKFEQPSPQFNPAPQTYDQQSSFEQAPQHQAKQFESPPIHNQVHSQSVSPVYAHRATHVRRSSGIEQRFQARAPRNAFVPHHARRRSNPSPIPLEPQPQPDLNPLLYPNPVKPEPTEPHSQPSPPQANEPDKDEPTRRGAMYYQRNLEDTFRKRARSAIGDIDSGFHDLDAEENQSHTDDEQQEHHYDHHHDEHAHYHQSSPDISQRPQPIVPSQAHERATAPAPLPHPTEEKKKEAPIPTKKPALACLFCRKRKIACGPPPPGSPDKTCNQCMRRKQPCQYPTESRRGIRKTPKEPVSESSDDGSHPTIHKFVHGDASSLDNVVKSKAKGRRKRTHEDMD